jgi:hypothetical protein
MKKRIITKSAKIDSKTMNAYVRPLPTASYHSPSSLMMLQLRKIEMNISRAAK